MRRVSAIVGGLAAMCAGVVLVAPTPAAAAGSAPLSALGVAYTQSFDSLASTGTSSAVPLGWDFAETGTNANLLYNTGTGSGTAGDTYSFGATGSAERAFGTLLSGSLTSRFGVAFTNDTGATITSLAVSYTGEMWRAGVTNRNAADRLDVQYSVTATTLTAATGWVDADALDYTSSNTNVGLGALDGNAAGNRTSIAGVVTGLAVAPGGTVWLRWVDTDIAPGSDDGLAVDDLSVVPLGVAADAAPAVASTDPTGGATGVLPASPIAVTFTEPVATSAGAFALSCSTSGAHTVALTGGPTAYSLQPSPAFASSDACTLRVLAGAVSDVDGDDPPDTMSTDYVTSFVVAGPDAAPAVAATVPADGATDVPRNQNVVVTFTEPVTVTEPWFTLTCATSGPHAATVSGGPTSFTLDPTVDFVFGERCTLVVNAGGVRDVDGNDPPDTMVVDFTAGFDTQLDPCTLPFTRIPQIQGSGPAAAITGSVTTQGVVVADYEYPGTGSTAAVLRGFYLQDPTGDGDPATSDAAFVFNGNANTVNVGDVVRVTGTAAEFQDQTQVSASSVVRCGTGTVTPVDVTFPVVDAAYLERFEGMLVRLPQTMYVTEHFQLGRFGQVLLSANGRLAQPTNVVAPGAAARALQAQNDLGKILLDDASQAQNPDPIVFGRNGQPLSAANTLRGGDTATGTVGVMTYTWAGNAASGNAYRVRPLNAMGGTVSFVGANPRPATTPSVGGTVRVVGMNLLNFFDTFTGCTGGVGGAALDCRGAENATEFARQYPKTVAAILALNPDVLGVNELENDGYGPTSALQFLVDRLNAATAPDTYGFVDVDAGTGQVNALGTDAIRVAQIYKRSVVRPVGRTAALNTDAFVNGGDGAPRSRPSLAQAYEVAATGARFVVDLNHLKSKGSACDLPDEGDGQGNCNAVRVRAATELAQWLASDPTGTGDPDVLLIGDYNSYAMEDPITALKNAGFVNLIDRFLGRDAYSYVFDGQWGYLDHALASPSLTAQVNGVADHHINADEPAVLDYNTNFKSAGQLASLYSPDQFRVSDHDPVVIGLTPNAPPTASAGGPYTVNEGAAVTLAGTGSDPNGDPLTFAWDLDGDGTFEAEGATPSFSAATIDGPATVTVRVRATDPGGLSAEATATVTVDNAAPTVAASYGAAPLACGLDNSRLTLTVADAAAADTHTATIAWGDGSSETRPIAAGTTTIAHTFAAAGRYTTTVTVTDDDGGTTTTTVVAAVAFTTSGVLPPIAGDGSSVFRYRSTIPVKVRFTDCNGTTPSNLAPRISVTRLDGHTSPWTIDEPASARAAGTTGVMRFAGGQYLYNLATVSLPDRSASYRITITVPATGQTVTARFGLRN